MGFDKVDVVKGVIDAIRPLGGSRRLHSEVTFSTPPEHGVRRRPEACRLDCGCDYNTRSSAELARRMTFRCVSVFLTPSGRASTMLFRGRLAWGAARELEAGTTARSRGGGGAKTIADHQRRALGWCRMTSPLTCFRTSLCSFMLRSSLDRWRSSSSPEAKICVWIADDATSAVRFVDVAVQARFARNVMIGRWSLTSESRRS